MLADQRAWQLFDAIGMTLSETLRAAGDTAWTTGARILLAWCVFTPVAFLVVTVWERRVRRRDGLPRRLPRAARRRARLPVSSGAWRRIELIEPRLV